MIISLLKVGISLSMINNQSNKSRNHSSVSHSSVISLSPSLFVFYFLLCLGIPDLLGLLVQLTQQMMNERLSYISELQCTVLEVKVVEGLGTTIDVVLVNGVLNESDTIVVCGLQGPIVTSIRALLTPPPMAELRIKSEYINNKSVKAAMGVKISAQGLEHAVAGTQLLVCGKKDNIEELKDLVQQDLATILAKIDKSGQGVSVQASTLGSLEALLQFLEDMKVRSKSHISLLLLLPF